MHFSADVAPLKTQDQTVDGYLRRPDETIHRTKGAGGRKRVIAGG